MHNAKDNANVGVNWTARDLWPVPILIMTPAQALMNRRRPPHLYTPWTFRTSATVWCVASGGAMLYTLASTFTELTASKVTSPEQVTGEVSADGRALARRRCWGCVHDETGCYTHAWQAHWMYAKVLAATEASIVCLLQQQVHSHVEVASCPYHKAKMRRSVSRRSNHSQFLTLSKQQGC
jgi:hypothetical protein